MQKSQVIQASQVNWPSIRLDNFWQPLAAIKLPFEIFVGMVRKAPTPVNLFSIQNLLQA